MTGGGDLVTAAPGTNVRYRQTDRQTDLTTVNVYRSRRSVYAGVGVGLATTVDAAFSPLTA